METKGISVVLWKEVRTDMFIMDKPSNSEISIRLEGISKSFPGVKALSDVNIQVRKGEVHALCGENGAGKSTLMKILTGNYRPDSGRISIRGDNVMISNQKHAQDLGISIVHQERSLVGNLSVAENIFTWNQPRNRMGFINKRELFQQTKTLLDQLNVKVDPNERIDDLSPGLQQMVEIAKALSQNPSVLILDEPTASITETETQILFDIIRKLTGEGGSVIYISHRMAEIFQIADTVTILKDGYCKGSFRKEDTCIDDVIKLMVGRDLSQIRYGGNATNETIFEVSGLEGRGFEDISFTLKKGEVLGFAGLVGAGRTEIARSIFGADQLLAGEILFEGRKVKIRTPADAVSLNIGYLPEERKEQGLFLRMSVEDNILAATLKAASQYGFMMNGQVTEIAENLAQRLKIKLSSIKQSISGLSGGNQQKVVIAKWLLKKPKVLIVDEPTHGVDVGAKSEIYQILQELIKGGTSIILISSELPEILALSDRILVIRNGGIVAELKSENTSEEEILAYASGTKEYFTTPIIRLPF